MTNEATRPTPVRRVAALISMAALVASVVVMATLALSNIVDIVIASLGLSVAIGGAWYSLSHRGTVRLLASGAVVAGLAIVVVVFVVGEVRLWPWLAVAVAAAISVGSAGFALREPHHDAPLADEPPAPRARRPVLLMNPKSGGGKVGKFRLERECRDRGIEPIVLGPGDDLLQLAEDAVARGADVIGMAGGDGSQALVGSVASAHGIPHVVIPAGTRNHCALDLGIDRDDVVGALDAYTDGVDRTVDLAEVNGRIFVNNATLGLYARIVQSPEYRDAKVQTSLEMLPDLIGPDAEPLDLRFTGPDGEEVPTAAVILVSNGPYELQRAKGRGSRERLDDGTLGIATLTVLSATDTQKLISLEAAGRLGRFEGWREWIADRFEVRSNGRVDVGVDGEALTMDPPLVFATRPGALTIRMPRHAPGRSPAASAVRVTEASTVRELLRIAGGKPRNT